MTTPPAARLTCWQIWGDNDNCRAEDPNGEWVRYVDVVAAEARAAALQAEVDRQKALVLAQTRLGTEANMRAIAAESRLGTLQPYVQHKQGCAYWMRKHNPTLDSQLLEMKLVIPDCTCGLAELLTPAEPQ